MKSDHENEKKAIWTASAGLVRRTSAKCPGNVLKFSSYTWSLDGYFRRHEWVPSCCTVFIWWSETKANNKKQTIRTKKKTSCELNSTQLLPYVKNWIYTKFDVLAWLFSHLHRYHSTVSHRFSRHDTASRADYLNWTVEGSLRCHEGQIHRRCHRIALVEGPCYLHQVCWGWEEEKITWFIFNV